MAFNIFELFMGKKSDRDMKSILPLISKINEQEPWAMELSRDQFPEQTSRFREELKNGKTLDDILPQAFALAREAARRTLGERPYDVQLVGSVALHQGRIMEMKTGEGKTLSSVAAAYLNAIPQEGVHIVTVNEYLAERDAEWMRPVFEYLGLTVGAIKSQMDQKVKIDAYQKDITYGTNNEFGFDYLRDNMHWSVQKVQRSHNFCIVDEIDSILIDEARTPLIISGSAQDDTAAYFAVNKLVSFFKECDKDPVKDDYPENPVGDYTIDEKSKRISFTDTGLNKAEKLLTERGLIHGSLFEESNFEYMHYLTQAMRSHKLFHKDVDYVVQDAAVQIVDEFTGRILEGRRYSDGLHQAIEAKENIRIAERSQTLATITFQNYFRMYKKISGMTGTAATEEKEFQKIYKLDVVVVPTNRPVTRRDEDDTIYLNEDFKFGAIADEIAKAHTAGQPVLVGTISIEKSEKLSRFLTKRGIRHEILNAKNHHREALIIAEAGAKGSVTIATNMAGRGTDIKLGGNPDFRARKKAGTTASDEDLRKVLAQEAVIWQKENEEVKNLGGLFVVGTERHESRRIDNQLRGRSGRQGDPGRSKFFVSLDDELMRLFGGERMKGFMSRMGVTDEDEIHHPWISKSIENAQTKVEDRNFEIRKHLLEFDDVLNEQRKFIYEQRDSILADTDLHERIVSTAEEMMDEHLEEFTKSQDDPDVALSRLRFLIKDDFLIEGDALSPGMDKNAIRKAVLQKIDDDIKIKKSLGDGQVLNQVIRMEYLRLIDLKWLEHLESLESLREAVYLRHYAQKNPLHEYRIEGFQIFEQMIYEIKTTIAKKIIKIRIQTEPAAVRPGFRAAAVTTNHATAGVFGSAGKSKEPTLADRAAPRSVQIVRQENKVGRNDPCPCGSGKKYKYCHGINA